MTIAASKPSGRFLVLGSSGMLGSMMQLVLREAGFTVVTTQRSNPKESHFFDARNSVGEIVKVIQNRSPLDAIVNCTGITRISTSSLSSVEEAFLVNSIFPWKLAAAAEQCGVRTVHISTDGVFRGRIRPYVETSACDAPDVYGLSKRAGEASLPMFLSVRCSIIGPDARGNGLLEWFLRHPDQSEVAGFTNHVWNGVTTRQLSAFVARLFQDRDFAAVRAHTPVIHFSPNRPLSKYRLLVEINKAFCRKIRVKPVEAPVAVQRVLGSRYAHLSLVPPKRLPVSAALKDLVLNSRPQEKNSA